MCIFNVKVGVVRSTRILVSLTSGGRQATVYENAVSVVGTTRRQSQAAKKAALEKKVKEDRNNANAMILPCPLSPGHDVIPLDFSKDSFSFAQLEKAFPQPRRTKARARKGRRDRSGGEKLKVVQVGAYSVSIAKSLLDLTLIDSDVFKVNEAILPALKERYSSGFGFVICAFNAANKIEPHPIGYIHDAPDVNSLFVPTLHIHDGEVHKKESFDHNIYSINTDNLSGSSPADLSKKYGTNAMLSMSEGLESKILGQYLAEINNIRRMAIRGMQDNVDHTFLLSTMAE
eukprot:TRINITY_DN3269_c0_g1_i1.p1 TRINITY_DN3269_c0_g1~~TRINITY_DN3269_c0_g1_i1.p1  ORF type:complete len:288 (-),score=23.86 TRINITY_DN3269_c0_g1_i1:160-1023(-)